MKALVPQKPSLSNTMAEKKEFTKNKEKITFIDLFAGAGGISEGFLQAYTETKYFDFILASDINTNCELTHRVRYNMQLGLSTKFICQDITDENFIDNLLKKIGNRRIDVITGGPSCQSFSLSGRRKKYDKRDDLFYHYLKVIRTLRPKYFVMENVKGILTKDGGKIKNQILKEIRSIIDYGKIDMLTNFVNSVYKEKMPFKYNILIAKINMEISDNNHLEYWNTEFFSQIESLFKTITKSVEYKVSKSNTCINTVRHGLRMLKERTLRTEIRKNIIVLKTKSDIDNDIYGSNIDSFIEGISDSGILEKISIGLKEMASLTCQDSNIELLQNALLLYAFSMDEVLESIAKEIKGTKAEADYKHILSQIRMYNIDGPQVLLSSDYGVPQNRERVVFIGCRKDQPIINNIPATIKNNEKVTVYEALWDLDNIGNGETVTTYKPVKPTSKYKELLKKRTETGSINEDGKLYNEWQKEGHLSHRFSFEMQPVYLKNIDELNQPLRWQYFDLHNHQTSSQNEKVRKRLKIIAEFGEYNENTKKALQIANCDSDKRNYTVLNPTGQSPTVVTMPDDFIHYSAHRAMTVREMARLQSFDDSFVFQGKRQTGGEKRKEEIPQFTLVGNAVPPLMARAIGNAILNNIK